MLFDVAGVRIIQEITLSSPFGIALAVFAARWLIFGFAVIVAYLISNGRPADRHAVREGGWSLALTLLVTAVAAYFIQRVRPFAAGDLGFTVSLLIPGPLNTAFPSGHTGASFAMASAVMSVNRHLGVAALITAGLIALGRIAVGVHYPSDVLGGMALGVSSFLIVRWLHKQIRKRDISASARHHHHA